SAIRARIGALARGLGLDPDSDDDLSHLHIWYKPARINIADPEWAAILLAEVDRVSAELVVVDVLRRAARLKENDQAAVDALINNLQPLLARASLCLLHHFVKLSELSKEREPGERVSGSGALFGALDTAIYITGSERGARRLRLAFDGRD